MRILIAGIDGYLGWSLAQHLTLRGHEVSGVDLFLRREWVEEFGSQSATPVASMEDRLEAFRETYGKEIFFRKGDLRDQGFVESVFRGTRPEAVVHFGEMPSAPYSMASAGHAVFTQTNNIVGTLNILYAMKEISPDAHLVKLGTMGEYGTPNVDIPEGFFEVEFRGRKDRLPFPRQAGSWYHWSKVHDSNNVMFACRIWGLRSTDIMQGVVYGTRFNGMALDERLLTRYDMDQCFGTAINRFCAQAVIGHPLTIFGKGGQKRGFLPLRDSMQCLTLALENPPAEGEYRVFNQFEEVYGVSELAERVRKVANEMGLSADIVHLENPRVEMEEHYFKPDHQHLLDLGYQPTHDMEAELKVMLSDLVRYRDRIEAVRDAVLPDVLWKGDRRQVGCISRPAVAEAVR
ncbi:MAG: UDP-sulfoquinovose synthase [Planctomycetota bacterium]